MDIIDFEWDALVVIKIIRKHSVTPEEVEQVFQSDIVVRSHKGVYLAFGRTFSGRYLLVVFKKKGRQIVKIITARDMTKTERRKYTND